MTRCFSDMPGGSLMPARQPLFPAAAESFQPQHVPSGSNQTTISSPLTRTAARPQHSAVLCTHPSNESQKVWWKGFDGRRFEIRQHVQPGDKVLPVYLWIRISAHTQPRSLMKTAKSTMVVSSSGKLDTETMEGFSAAGLQARQNRFKLAFHSHIVTNPNQSTGISNSISQMLALILSALDQIQQSQRRGHQPRYHCYMSLLLYTSSMVSHKYQNHKSNRIPHSGHTDKECLLPCAHVGQRGLEQPRSPCSAQWKHRRGCSHSNFWGPPRDELGCLSSGRNNLVRVGVKTTQLETAHLQLRTRYLGDVKAWLF